MATRTPPPKRSFTLSRLNDLLRQLRMDNPRLADDLQQEVDALADRRSFGLNFERHVPEAVELPGRKVRKGDKVRVLPPRGELPTAENDRLWKVVGFNQAEHVGTADLVSLEPGSNVEITTAVADLVVVAEFRDPIYPGLVSTGKVERGGDKPFHTVINAENFHALQTLLFTHRAKVDCIYIDPPYNTGARDWKYNNDYVEGDDHYRHSKWLAFMERRLEVAKELLNPDESVLIATIDEKEYLRLGLLLEQTFPQAEIQMVSSVINPGGSVRRGAFSRTDEYLYFVFQGEAEVEPLPLGSEWRGGKSTSTAPVAWRSLLRGGQGGRRRDRPNMFYPVFVSSDGSGIHSIGNPIGLDESAEAVEAPAGTYAVWPRGSDGQDGRWRTSTDTARANHGDGLIRANESGKKTTISYLAEGVARSVREGEIETHGRDERGVVKLGDLGVARIVPGTTWSLTSHNARDHGSAMLANLVPGRDFPFPKSLYAVEDAVQFFLATKSNAVVVDFFGGSGTTTHDVMRLNRRDGGSRQSILVTNNEVAFEEQRRLVADGLRPGDNEWEDLGICDHITKPRVEAAVTGKTYDGKSLEGSYRFDDSFPLSDGLEANVEFFSLVYEAPLRVSANREFRKIAPLLWLRAGSTGRRIEDIAGGWAVADTYAVIADLDAVEEFRNEISSSENIRIAYIVTDEDKLFEEIVADLPSRVEPVRLYEAYLRNFEIEAGRSTR